MKSKETSQAKVSNKKQKKQLKVSKTVQQSIPYESMYATGIIETAPGCFSKSYYFGDANFREEDMSKQMTMFEDYGVLLNKFQHNITTQISIFNRSIDIDEVKNNILLKPNKDSYNNLREEMNEVLLDKMSEGQNNIKKERYFTVCINNTDIESAVKSFATLDSDIDEAFRNINGTGAKPLTLTERLNILYEIYNINSPVSFEKKMQSYFTDGEIDLRKLIKHGFTTKDIIGPEGIVNMPKEDYVKMGNQYVRTFFLDDLPTFANTSILSSITDMSCNLLTSVMYRTLPQKKALKYIRRQLTNISGEVVKMQKNATKGGYSTELISPELRRAHSEAEALLSSITSGNQKIFFATITFTLFAKDLETLDKRTEQLSSRVANFSCQNRSLIARQLQGFNTTLPLATFTLDGTDRILNTESASVFYPFNMQEIMDKQGFYYGLNALSRNMIVYNRTNSSLPNGLVFGRSGSGKSMASKIEMFNTFLGSDDDIIIIDPEGEYSEMAQMLGGQVVYVANGTNTYINPLDMDINYAKDGNNQGDPVAMKCDFLTTICETIVGKNIGLTPYDVNIIHRCGTKIYQPYMEHLLTLKDKGITCDRNATPTLIEFYDELSSQPEPEARKLAMSLELYCVGNYDIFAHKTNIDVNSRFLVYNVKNIVGAANKELAVQICLNDVWNRIIENKLKGKSTWVYLDEFYLFTKTEKSVGMLQEYFKRSRKWSGILTGITQDVEDVLITPEARGIFNNCGFLLMMNQSPIGRGELAELYHISPNLLKYITDKPPGTGLLYNGTSIVPFENKFPTDTSLYKIMTTKPSDDN